VARRNRQTNENHPPSPVPGAERKATQRRPAPKANPLRPNKLFLAFAVVLLLSWMSFLGIMAYLVRA
jgi:hypothetical protein